MLLETFALSWLQVLVLLVFAHFLADYPLQGDFLSKAKNRTNPIPGVPWWQAMTAHTSIHAGLVFIITGSWICMLMEFVTHFGIDDDKCSGVINFNQDQLFHLSLKVLYVIAIFGLGFP